MTVNKVNGIAATPAHKSSRNYWHITDVAIIKNMPGASVKIPARLFTPELITLVKQGGEQRWLFNCSRKGNAENADQWSTIPAAAWMKIISDFAPVSIRGDHTGAESGKCPFCHKRFRGCSGITGNPFADLTKNPFRAKAICCETTVYGNPEAMPVNYIAKPNHKVNIAHLDGTTREYVFFVTNADKNSANWFYSEGEVWNVRLAILMNHVLPDLARAVFLTGDAKAAKTIAIILDRLATVYPGLPLYDVARAHGFARGRDGKSYLTREEYRSVKRPEPYEFPFYWRNAYSFAKLNWGLAGWQDGVMKQAGYLAELFALVRHHPEFRKYGIEHYGSEVAFDQHLRTHLLEEAAQMCIAVKDTRGNTLISWIFGAIKLGVVLQNEYLVSHALELLENFIPNGYYSDGLCIEAAFNYSAMMRSFISSMWLLEHFGGIDPKKRYPALALINRLGDYPVITLRGVESQHSDEHARFFTSYKQPALTANYNKHSKSQCFPEYGLTALRGGAPERRLEAIIDYQSAIGHGHFGKLNMQLFYEGINVMPDFGYGCVVADVTKDKWKNSKYPFELLPCPSTTDVWGAWTFHYNYQGEMHNTVLVNGTAGKEGPCSFQRYLGGSAGMVQFVEAEAQATFKKTPFKKPAFPSDTGVDYKNFKAIPMERYNRQVATIPLPTGQSLALSFFRVIGGKQHDFYWHFPAGRPNSSLGDFTELPFPTVQAYRQQHGMAGVKVGEALKYLNSPVKWAMPDQTWRTQWLIKPNDYTLALSVKGQAKHRPWTSILRDAQVTMWSAVRGSETVNAEIIGARGPWPSNAFDSTSWPPEVIAYKDAIDYMIISRSAKNSGLSSTYVNVLDATLSEQPSSVRNIKIITPANDHQSVAIRIDFLDLQGKLNSAWVASTANGEQLKIDNIELLGRFGYVCKTSPLIMLYDGSYIAADGWELKTTPTVNATLIGVIGDLSGSPHESALIIESKQPLPTDNTLQGTMLTVHHQSNKSHTTGYTIDRVRALGNNRWRLDLKDKPPFIQHKMKVRTLAATGTANWIETSGQLYKGQSRGLYTGRTIRFPRTGFETVLLGAPFSSYHPWNTDRLALKQVPTKDEVTVGDQLIVYTIKPGDKVVLPSHASCTGTPIKNGLKINIVATGTVELTIPGGYTKATKARSTLGKPLDTKILKDGRMSIKLKSQQALIDGQITLIINR